MPFNIFNGFNFKYFFKNNSKYKYIFLIFILVKYYSIKATMFIKDKYVERLLITR